MTPKEQAEYMYLKCIEEEAYSDEWIKHLNKEMAKVLVDGVIEKFMKESTFIPLKESDVKLKSFHLEYWQEVKTEIEKL